LLNKAELYIERLLSGEETAGAMEKAAVHRHVQDLKKQEDAEFPFIFDPEAGIRPAKFVEMLKHTKGKWARQRLNLVLEPWQWFILYALFGWKRKDTGTRRFTKAYIEVARKNGKTTLAAGLANYCFLADYEEGAEVYCCATKKDQAKIAWNEAAAQIERNSTLRNATKTIQTSSTVIKPGTQSRMKALAQDSDTEDGLNPHFVLIDEYHAHKSSSMVNVMEDGMGAREQPMLFIITTAGFDKNSPCYQEERSLVKGILEGTIDPRPENVFGIIYSLDEDDDWTNEHVWRKANPNLGISVDVEFLRKQVTNALASPQKQNSVLTKNFNKWTQAVTRWILPEAWDVCKAPLPDLSGRKCYGAFDLSSTTDLTAWVKVFPPIDLEKHYIIQAHFFIPKENILDRQRRDKVPYLLWRDKGYITLTDGNVIDYRYIEEQILQDATEYDLQEVAYDPYNAKQSVLRLEQEGIVMVQFRQGFISMSGASKDFEKRVLNSEINHGGNPVLTWMISCTEVATDPAGNIKPVKPEVKSFGKRIDGVVASIMALERATVAVDTTSVYEERGLLFL
jgi:phage terminase large subunit-like protein